VQNFDKKFPLDPKGTGDLLCSGLNSVVYNSGDRVYDDYSEPAGMCRTGPHNGGHLGAGSLSLRSEHPTPPGPVVFSLFP